MIRNKGEYNTIKKLDELTLFILNKWINFFNLFISNKIFFYIYMVTYLNNFVSLFNSLSKQSKQSGKNKIE